MTAFFQGSTDPDGQAIFNITDWRMNGQSLAIFNLAFETTNNTLTRDYSTRGKSVKVYGPNWTSNGAIGGAYTFNGSSYPGVNNSISVVNGSSGMGNQEFTLEAWVNTTSITSEQIIMNNMYEVPNAFFGILRTELKLNGSGVPVFTTPTNASDLYIHQLAGNTSLTPYVWNHIVGTYSEQTNTSSLYVNGVLIKNDPKAGEPSSLIIPGTFHIGSRMNVSEIVNTSVFKGRIDEVKVYNRSLTPEQIRVNYLLGLNGKPIDLIVEQETHPAQNWSIVVTPNEKYLLIRVQEKRGGNEYYLKAQEDEQRVTKYQ